MRASKPITALTHLECFEAVREASQAFAAATHMPRRYASRSWFLNEFARILGRPNRVHGPRARSTLHVQTEVNTTHLGNFQSLIDKVIDPPIDVIACSPWGGLELSDEEYGTDERLLPSFYLISILFNQQDKWVFPEDIANKIAGPVTITIVNINLFEAERSFNAARNFERAMKERNISWDISTQFIVPGVLASVTLAERTEPHQVLVTSQIFDREPIPNSEYGKVRE